MTTHAKSCDEGIFWNEGVFCFHLGIELFVEEFPPLHFRGVQIIKIPAIVKTIRTDNSETTAVAYLLEVIMGTPIFVASTPSVQKNHGRKGVSRYYCFRGEN